MRRLALIGCIAVIAGCGSDRSEALPAPCTDGPSAVLRALAGAPGDVRMRGVRISECFNRDAAGQDEQIVGTSLIAAAQQLADRAREDPEGDAALQLGYLVGAARRGARRNGLAAEMIRRLEQEPRALADDSEAYRRGLRAGQAKG